MGNTTKMLHMLQHLTMMRIMIHDAYMYMTFHVFIETIWFIITIKLLKSCMTDRKFWREQWYVLIAAKPHVPKKSSPVRQKNIDCFPMFFSRVNLRLCFSRIKIRNDMNPLWMIVVSSNAQETVSVKKHKGTHNLKDGEKRALRKCLSSVFSIHVWCRWSCLQNKTMPNRNPTPT